MLSSGSRVQITALCSPPDEDALSDGTSPKTWQVQQAAFAHPVAPVWYDSSSQYVPPVAVASATVLHPPVVLSNNIIDISSSSAGYEQQARQSRRQPSPDLADQQRQSQRQEQEQQPRPRRASANPKKRSSRMTNSARGKLYRSRRKKYTDGLGDYVEDLRKEVEDLTLYHRTQCETLLHSSARGLDATAPFARVVCEYFSLFEFGVPVLAALEASSSSSGGGGSSIPRDALVRSSRQAGFLNSMVSPNVLFGGTRGVQLLLEQWERYSMYHTKLQLVLQTLDVVVADSESPVISAKAVLRVRFSRLTIQKVFPHVLWNEALVQRLIGLEIDYPVGNTFYFGADGKIHGYETEVDFIVAFVQALGSIQDAIELVGHALIKQQHMIGAEEDEDEDAEEEVRRRAAVGGREAPY